MTDIFLYLFSTAKFDNQFFSDELLEQLKWSCAQRNHSISKETLLKRLLELELEISQFSSEELRNKHCRLLIYKEFKVWSASQFILTLSTESSLLKFMPDYKQQLKDLPLDEKYKQEGAFGIYRALSLNNTIDTLIRACALRMYCAYNFNDFHKTDWFYYLSGMYIYYAFMLAGHCKDMDVENEPSTKIYFLLSFGLRETIESKAQEVINSPMDSDYSSALDEIKYAFEKTKVKS